MSEEAGQRSEAASDRKLERARETGDVPVAAETRHALMLGGAWLGGAMLAGDAAARLAAMIANGLEAAGTRRLTAESASRYLGEVLGAAALLGGPALALLCVAALATGFAQGPFAVAGARVQPKWSKVSPAAGLKRLFGGAGLAAFGKTIVKLAAIVAAGLWVLVPEWTMLERAAGADLAGLTGAAGSIVLRLLAAVAGMLAVLAVLDQLWTRLAFARRMRMTKQEVRDEHRDSDGDPLLKARRRTIGRSRARMMAAVPGATVVVVNPTHYAVALAYEHGVSAAPRVVAKGIDELALRIRAAAEAAGVPVVEDPLVARTLHAVCEVGREIPRETYVAVAELIRYVMGRRA